MKYLFLLGSLWLLSIYAVAVYASRQIAPTNRSSMTPLLATFPFLLCAPGNVVEINNTAKYNDYTEGPTIELGEGFCAFFYRLGASFTEVPHNRSRRRAFIAGYSEFRIVVVPHTSLANGSVVLRCTNAAATVTVDGTVVTGPFVADVAAIGPWTPIPSTCLETAGTGLRLGMADGDGTRDVIIDTVNIQAR